MPLTSLSFPVRWLPWLGGVLAWSLAGFSVAYWVLRWSAHTPAVALPVVAAAPAVADSQAVARALGAVRPAPGPAAALPVASASRYVLTGVVAPVNPGAGGVALIAVEGQKPNPYRVGAVLDGRWRVQSIDRRAVQLQAMDGATTESVRLDLPPEKH